MSSLYQSGIRPTIDNHLLALSQERRNYGEYWSASSAGYCMRKVIFDRLGVPYTQEDARKQRVFSAGHIFHRWIQELTRQAGISMGQEMELIEPDLMIKGHIDDLVMVNGQLILYDYKTKHSKAFTWAKKTQAPMSHYHRMQLGTYLLMLNQMGYSVKEARILSISKDDLRMDETQLFWTPELESEVRLWWQTLNAFWKANEIPDCSCADQENGFMAREAYNPYFYRGEPCSMKLYKKWLKENAMKEET